METVRTLPVPPLMLGEGPVWHARRETLYFVDIDGCMIYGWQDGLGLVTRLPMPDRTGFVVPWGGGLLAGAGDALYRVDPDSAEITPVLRLALDAGVRFNDGKCDPEGRLWAGVMAVDRSRTDTAALGALYGIVPEGPFQRLAPMDIPNGMAWDASGAFYHTDTATGRILRYRRGADGRIHDPETAVTVEDGAPDGMCIDGQGMLWVALWGAGRVQRYDPQTGRALKERIDVPESNASCCCLGGADGKTLYITTAQSDGQAGGGCMPAAWRYPARCRMRGGDNIKEETACRNRPIPCCAGRKARSSARCINPWAMTTKRSPVRWWRWSTPSPPPRPAISPWTSSPARCSWASNRPEARR